MPWNSTFWSHLKLTVQMQPALDLCDTFEINKLNMEMLLQKQPPEVFCKKVFLDISQISQENTCATPSLKIVTPILKWWNLTQLYLI